MLEHSPEPWEFTKNRDSFVDKNGAHIWVYCDTPDAHRIIACVNACTGINPEAVPELRSVLLEAVQEYDKHSPNVVDVGWLDSARAALALAKPAEP